MQFGQLHKCLHYTQNMGHLLLHNVLCVHSNANTYGLLHKGLC
jgi:hypothetical protein